METLLCRRTRCFLKNPDTRFSFCGVVGAVCCLWMPAMVWVVVVVMRRAEEIHLEEVRGSGPGRLLEVAGEWRENPRWPCFERGLQWGGGEGQESVYRAIATCKAWVDDSHV